MVVKVGECYISDDRIYRVLRIKEHQDVVVIDVEDASSWEVFIPYEAFQENIRTHKVRFVPEPHQSILVADDNFNAKQIQRRDKRWALIQPLIFDEHGNLRLEILDRTQRGKIISEYASETGVSKDTLYDCIRLFLKRGMVKNALIPLGFEKIGNKGQRKQRRLTPIQHRYLERKEEAEDQAQHEQQEDEPQQEQENQAQHEQQKQRTITAPSLSDKDIEQLRNGYKTHYVNNRHTSLKSAYQRTLDDHYSTVTIEDGVRHVRRYPKEVRPTFDQFLYWTHEARDPRKDSREARNRRNRRTGKGDGPPNLTERGRGPGSEVMADWTKGHRLLSSHNKTIDIGRAYILFLICVFSRMVVGFHVGTKENWESVMLGVQSMAMDKDKFCAQYSKEVPKELWPCAFVPDRLFYDGGKLDQHNTSGIVAMGVDAQTGIPYTPELRAIIEVLNRKIKRKLAEYLGNTHKKDLDDDKAVARVNRHTYIRIIIEVILEYNQEPIPGYPLTQDMREKAVPPVPIKLYEYGLSNISRPRQFELSLVRFNVLPNDKAQVHRKHVSFRGLTYDYETDSEKEKAHFYGKALLKKQHYYLIDVKYDLGCVDYIFLYEGRKLVGVCSLAGNDRQFRGCSWQEVEEQHEADKRVTERHQDERDASQQYADTRAKIEDDLKRAEEEARQAQHTPQQWQTTAMSRAQRNAEAQALTKANAARPEDVGATGGRRQVPVEQKQSDPDVTMPATASSTTNTRLPPAVEKVIRGNRVRRRRS